MRFLTQTLLISCLLLFACRKDSEIYSNVSEIPGKYSGDNYHTYIGSNGQEWEGWGLYKPTIQENDYHSVKINHWSSGIGNVILEVSRNGLTIKDQTDTVTSYGMGGAYVYQYLLKLNATGSYDPIQKSIYLSYTEETSALNSNEFDTSKVGYIYILK